ncbi:MULTISPECIES: preprotein translocase subunit SecE [Trueperella]|uniref:Protein translocase subunit SecE n=1 Tax=Trueperella bernardiae TaxID=59561 RepID=A0A0W1KKF5_9ACTO|nr:MULTISPECIES: preprotein translocase subunit SecE [Trueperella]KTF04060.1 Protein translocase subunit SecE [Trueperella bernardiae]MCM3907108.1 preprotein translocase subunit SecE [Trueperella bernardiae]MDK8601513.1 preprotein translocase subunit SecE [Trueperella bernardiae]MDV6239310.1 preprotein translocase subunit SecE [Trueperella bernardiae]OCW60472.1 preprotein translocase subunit SecE [Trueperella bernardiae]
MSQAASRRESESKGLWQRIITFFKEVVAELKKVQRPTRKELWQLFLTVVFFVAVVMVFVGVIDVVFNQAMFWIFG